MIKVIISSVVLLLVIYFFIVVPYILSTAPDMKDEDSDEDMQAYYDYLAELNALDEAGDHQCKVKKL